MPELARTGVVVGLLVGAGVPFCRLIGMAAARVGLPRVAGEMAGGLGLGALALSTHGLLVGDALPSASVWAVAVGHARTVLSVLATGAIATYLGLVGLRVGLAPGRAQWRRASILAAAYCAATLAIGGPVATAIQPGSLRPPHVTSAAFAALAVAVLTTNGLPVVARLLSDQGRLQTSIGLLALSSGILVSVVTFAGLRAADLLNGGRLDAGATAVGLAAVLAGLAPLGTTAVRVSDRPGARFDPRVGIALAASAGLGSHLLLGSWIPGPFAVGLLMARRQLVSTSLAHSWVKLAGRRLLPVYFLSAGGALGAMHVTSSDVPAVLLASAAVTLAAWPTTQLAGVVARLQPGDRRDLADLSVCRGIVIIIVALQASHARLIGEPAVLSLAIAGVASTCVAGLLIRLAGPRPVCGPPNRIDRRALVRRA